LTAPLHSVELPDAVECPFCRKIETEQFSAFGSALSVSQYYCRTCRTVFEFMKRQPGKDV
jgi:rubredoxin